MINLYNKDSEKEMPSMNDNGYDLGIVDPIYGDAGIIGGYISGKGGGVVNQKKYNKKIWHQIKTGQDYFDELFLVTKNQIIFGANHFVKEINKNNSAWIFWNKKNGGVSFSDGEFAYTSFNTKSRIFEYRWSGMLQENMKNKEIRIHPTQKPVALYKWILQNYAKKGDKILDTHGGSMSLVIACIELGFSIDCYEIDKDYFNDAVRRIYNHYRQLDMFQARPVINCNGIDINEYIKMIA